MKAETVRQVGRCLRQAGKQLSLDRAVAEFQSALFCADQFGICAALIVGLCAVASFLLQAARTAAEKGVL